jgi:hypothetical protein
VPVVTMDEENGSTEVWPGSHLDTTMSIQLETIKVPEGIAARRREIAPPLQPRVEAGSILIRDMRLWHRGMPNRTEEPRPMIAMIHTCRWWHDGGRLTFPRGCETLFQDSDLTTVAQFVEGPIDYLHRNKAYHYQPESAS